MVLFSDKLILKWLKNKNANKVGIAQKACIIKWNNIFRKEVKHSVLLSYCCCNKVSQTQWLKTIQINFLIVLKTRGPKWVSVD